MAVATDGNSSDGSANTPNLWFGIRMLTIPESQEAVVGARSEPLAVVAHSDLADRARVLPFFLPCQWRTIRHVAIPDLHSAVMISRNQPAAVLAQSETCD